MSIGRAGWSIAAFVAFAYLVAMFVAGALPEQRQLVKFAANGLMTQPPENITRVDLEFEGRRVTFVRSEGHWLLQDKGPLPQALAEKLALAVQVMHTSAPVRVMEAAEFGATDPREFGLDTPPYSVTLYEGSTPALRAHFGGLNPEKFLQYMAVDGRPQLFLMSLFVGEEWSAVADGVGRKQAALPPPASSRKADHMRPK